MLNFGKNADLEREQLHARATQLKDFLEPRRPESAKAQNPGNPNWLAFLSWHSSAPAATANTAARRSGPSACTWGIIFAVSKKSGLDFFDTAVTSSQALRPL
jgi:hypothetical protein